MLQAIWAIRQQGVTIVYNNLSYANNFGFASAVTATGLTDAGWDRTRSSWWCRSLISHAVSLSSVDDFL